MTPAAELPARDSALQTARDSALPSNLDAALNTELAALDANGLRRRLVPGSGLDFASNDYLGLVSDVEAQAAIAARIARAVAEGEPLLAPAARLLRGETATHQRLEARLANWKGQDAALLFASGYQANLGLVTALAGPGDRLVSDALNHASLIDAARLSGAEKVIFPHLDLAAVEQALATPHPGRTLLLTESLFSMDGDAAPLAAYAELCERHGAHLVVDEAHASGLYGAARGSGRIEELGLEAHVAAVTTTFGKALGLAGACVSGSLPLIDLLVQRARPFFFSTAVPPLALLALEALLDFVAARPERRRQALDNAALLRAALVALRLPRPPGDGAIVPIAIGDNLAALSLGERLQSAGFDVRAVRPPTVPPGTARLRISVHADHRRADLEALAELLAKELAP